MTSREKFIQYLEDEKSYIKQYLSKEVQKETEKTIENTQKSSEKSGPKQIFIVLNDNIKEKYEEFNDIQYLIRVMKINDDEWRDINGINNITGILSEYMKKHHLYV